MEYYKIISLICMIKSWEVASITTRIEHNQRSVRNFRRHAGPSPPSDWELGLKEAAHQALLREHHNADPGVRDQLLEAPLIGRHDGASPFGDIAVLARGQLYGTHGGFKFVQDQDDCSDKHGCHQQWQSADYSNLLALWTVKRIRHRDPKHGYVFEIEYTISPITPAINEEIHRHGFFNYNVPGHIFVIKSDPRLNSAYYLNNNKQFHDKWHPQSDQQQQQQHVDNPHSNQDAADNGNEQFKPGILIGIAPNGYKHILHSLPGFYTSYHPSVSYPDQTTIDPKEYELYKKLIESLASKTTPQNGYAEVPHRFAVTSSTTAKVPIKQYYPENGFVHFPSDGSLSTNSITTSTTSKYQNNEYTSNPVRFPLTTTGTTKYSQPDMVYHTLPPTVPVVLHQHADIFDDPVKPLVTQLTTASKATTAQTVKYSQEPSPVPVFTTKIQTVPIGTTTQFTQSTNSDVHTSAIVPSFGTKITESIAVPVQTTHFVESTSALSSTVPKTSSFPTQVTTTRTYPSVYQSTTRENPRQTNKPETTYLTTTRRIPQTTISHASTPTRRIPPKTTSNSPQPIHEPETTIYYYTPVEEEVQFSTPPKPSKKPTSNKIKTTTTKKYTTKAPLPDFVDEFDLFPAVQPTEAMKPESDSNTSLETTSATIDNIYQSSVNDQLPPPEKNTETTIPYISSTVTQATITSSPIIQEKHTSLSTTIQEHPSTIETENILSTETGPSTLYERATEDTRTSTTQEKITTIKDQKENEKITTTTIDIDSTLPEKEQTNPFVSTTNIYTAFNTKNPFETTEIEQMLSTTGRITTLPTTLTDQKETEVISTVLDTTKYSTRPSPTYNSLEVEKTDRMSTSEPIRTTLQDRTTLNHIKTTTTQRVKPSTTPSSDDLFNDPEINNYNKQPAGVINQNKDVNEDDIFGEAPSTFKPQSSSTQKQIVQSDLADALFGGRRAKQIKVSSVLTTTTPFVTPKVIYSNFYAPSTDPMPTSPYFETTPRFIYETSRNIEEETTELIRPVTDTSVSTSISFEVNKRNSTRPVLNLEPTIMAHVTEIVDPKSKFKIYKAELPRTTTEKVVESETTKRVFDDFALQLVNHAKTIDYLNAKKTSTSRQPKYKRRRYDPKRRASQRRIS